MSVDARPDGVWRGYYFDGRRPVRHLARVNVATTGMEIAIEDGPTLWWPYTEVRQAQGAYDGERLTFERGGQFPEMLVVHHRRFLAELHRVAPDVTRAFVRPMRRARRWLLSLMAAAAVVVLSGALYVWGLPALATTVAARVPPSWEANLGERTVAHLAPPERRCTAPEVHGALQEILRVLLATERQPSPYRFHLFVVNDDSVNAFAAPGGYLVVHRGLLAQTGSPEELAGVLAHEVQHVLRRHATRSVVQHASTGLLLAAVMGEPTGAVAYGIEAARLLGTLRYSRLHEDEADSEGMKMLLAAKVNPEGMIRFFDTLHASGGMPGLLKYVSTHPSTEDRIARLRAMAAGATAPAVPLLEGQDWDETKTKCGPPTRGTRAIRRSGSATR